MSHPTGNTQSQPLLASRYMPRRVRELLEGVLEVVRKQFEPGLLLAGDAFERQLMKQAEQAKDHEDELRLVDARHAFSRGLSDLLRRFHLAIEGELANLREPQIVRGQIQARATRSEEMSLVDNIEMDETSVLTDIASRAELRHSLPIYLLGQRFGVLSGRPGFDPETMPVGPKALCRAIRVAAEATELTEHQRVMLFRAFDQHAVVNLGLLLDAINKFLIDNGVLPNMQYVPVRLRPTARSGNDGIGLPDFTTMGLSLEEGDASRSARSDLRAGGRDPDQPRPAGGWQAHTAAAPAAAANMPIEALLQMLSSRRNLLGRLGAGAAAPVHRSPPVQAADLHAVLRRLQSKPAAPVMVDGQAVPRTVAHLKQDMLAALRQFSAYKEDTTLSERDSGVIDLMGMLYDNLMKDVRPGSAAANLLSRMQVTLLRASLDDPQFFVGEQHPARQMLDTITNTGAHWLADEDPDPGLVDKLNSVVDRSAREYNGDFSVFKQLLEDLLEHLKTLTHKAGVAERRHVDAARGKEKLALARDRAAEVIEAMCKGQKLPRFTRTMLTQAWTDVMALTALRRGEESDAWQQQLAIAGRLIELADAKSRPDDADSLQNEIQQGLTQVGYLADEAGAIAMRLVDPTASVSDEGGSRTELTMRLKSGARLGENLESASTKKTPLTAEQQAHLERIKQVAFGTWFDFTTNQQGDVVRRRLSWFSTATGHALFVNHRGQKVAEFTLENLARLMAKNQLKIVETESTTILDRAWSNVVAALQSFTPEGKDGGSRP